MIRELLAWWGPLLVVAVAIGVWVWAGLHYGLEKANSLAGVLGGIGTLIGVPAAVFGLRALRAVVGSGQGGAGTGADSGIALRDGHVSLRPPVLQAPVRGRDQELGKVQELLTGRHQGGMAVVCGGGGLGKTTLAAEVARRAVEAGTAVFWLRWRDDPARLAEDLTLVARTLRLPGALLDEARTGQAVLVDTIWAHLAATDGWLIVVDNVDTPTSVGPGSDPIADGRGWLRPDGAGLLLVTSRDTRQDTWGTRARLIRLEPLTDDAAATVLRDAAPNAGSSDDARALGARLGGLPLALDAVGTYLVLPTSRYRTFASYQQALGREFGDLIGASHPQANDPDVARTIIRHTWDLSLDQLSDDGYTLARPALHLLALLAPAPAPRGLLTPHLLSTITCRAANGADLDGALAGLHQYGLLTADTTPTGIGTTTSAMTGSAALTDPHLLLHPLVRDVMAHSLHQAVPDTDPWYEALDSRLIEAATDAAEAGSAGWPTARLLAAHLPHLLDRATDATSMSRRHTLNQLSNALNEAGAALEEHLLRESVFGAALERHGLQHPETLVSLNNLANSLRDLGRYQEAVDLHRRNLTDLRRVLGPEHPSTLGSSVNLANSLRDLGRYQEAVDLHRRNLTDLRRILGPEHPSTLITRNGLASALTDLGRLEEAAALHQQVLTDRERILGPEHPSTLVSRSNLAITLRELGRYQEAADLHQQVLTDRERILGPQHPDTLSSRSNLASALADLGRLEEAAALHQQVLTDRERILGPEHPSILVSRSSLAKSLIRLERYQEAAGLDQQNLTDRERILGPQHPDTLDSRNNLAHSLIHLGHCQEAANHFQRNLTDYERVLGSEHPDTLTSRNSLAFALSNLGRFDEARDLLQQNLTDYERILGPQHPDTLESRQLLTLIQGVLSARPARGQRRQFWRRGRR
ncbi:FxSxx-COOH system tetratricopeptide repeat protein [Streptomyces sp. NBC_00056]|uniref:FxSxx-COOH system tetratricopeptide repeat protein n=1 Tax=Streptomyces sp. NBC_00056 TaxID=2975633 RepID=UPI003248CDCD